MPCGPGAPPSHLGMLGPVLGALSLLLAPSHRHTQHFCPSLQENAIGDEGMAALSAALKVNTTLADLQ